MKRTIIFAIFLILAVFCQGQSFYYTWAVPGSGSFSFDASHWTENLDPAFIPPGIGSWTGSSGRFLYGTHVAAISNVAVPDGTSDYEVQLTIDGTGTGLNGNYNIYLRASSNTTDANNSTNPGAGTAYVVRITNSGWVHLDSRVNGVETTLASVQPGAAFRISPIVVRTVIKGNNIGIWVNNYLYLVYQDSTITSGQPGFGFSDYGTGYGDGNGNPLDGVVEIDLGSINRTGPPPISNLGTSVLPNRVDMQWSGGIDSAGTAYETISRTGLSANLDPAPGGSGTNPPVTVFSDTAVAPSTSYTYTVTTTDLWFVTTTTSFNITTPPTGSVDPRRVGINSIGASWGDLGEQIDLLSGNLNYTVPLMKAQGRGGWGVGFNLTYNSQNWRQDPGGIWQLGQDVGYGFGWKLQAGSLTPFWTNYWTVDHYTFTDASGAQYRLNQDASGIWTSNQSIYLTYNPSTQTLYFPDGSFWVFGDTSDATQPDSGTMYPTKMEDTNGNQVFIVYTGTNARIWYIQDVRGGSGNTYSFYYTNSHLTSISNWIGTAESYNFTYSAAQTLYSPFSSASFGQTQMLQTAGISGLNLTYSFTQDATGALTQVNLPYGGYLGWAYAEYTYSGSREQPEVQTRYLSSNGVTQTTYPIARDPADSGRTVHNYANIIDPGGVGEKTWFFNTNGTLFTVGLLASREDQQLPGPTVKANTQYTWAQDSVGNAYVSSALVTLDPGASYQAQKQTNQTLDIHGNLTALSIYDFGNLTTPARQYQYTYLSNYGYIYNRLVTAQVEGGSGPWQTLVTNSYDGQAVCSGYSGTLASVSGQTEHDDTNYGTGYITRGNVTESVSLTGTSCAQYDMLGNATQTQNPIGQTTSYTYGNNYAVPTGIAMGVYTNTINWSSFLGQTQNTDQNTATTAVQYDSYGRPSQTTGVNGAVTTYTYTTSPLAVTATINGRWTTTTSDGLGRTSTITWGTGSITQSTLSYVYGSAAVSPSGVLIQQSVPYAPGATEYWATTTYDGVGRTISSQKPDAASTTTYAYQGNSVTVTDPAGNWKQLTVDAMGDLILATEPNPAGGANITTTSTYSPLGQVTQVQRTVSSNTQTRTFSFNGAFLARSTAPETGTVNYTYNSNGTLANKIDAKNQKISYLYDSLARVTYIHHWSSANNSTWDQYGTVVMTYDTASGWNGTNLRGKVANINYYVGNSGARQVNEYFSYTPSGLVNKKRLKVGSISLDGVWTFDNEGRATSVQYPTTLSGTGSTYTITYDTMGRANGMTDQNNNTLVSAVSYGPSNELLGMTYLGYTQTRQYNNLKQMTRLTTTGSSDHVDFQYSFSATQNNGKVIQMQDFVSGEQVTYAYDALLRLASAATTANPNVPQWGQSYTYDGFGNLTGQTVTQGTAPYMQVVVNPATNQVVGGSYDANGNDTSFGTYDVENRLMQTTGGAKYGYAPANKRVWKAPDGIAADEEFYFWTSDGKRLGTYKSTNPGTVGFTTASTNLYFKGLIQAESTAILKDRLGSNVSGGKRYFPYGQEKPSATTNNTEKFTGYFRDAETGLDYADQRYHNPGTGRFTTPDPAKSGLNWYSYAGGDPINRRDPHGLDSSCDPEVSSDCSIPDTTTQAAEANDCFDGAGPDTSCYCPSLYNGFWTSGSGCATDYELAYGSQSNDPTAQPSDCSVQLYERPATPGSLGYDHTYLFVQCTNYYGQSSFVVDGDPGPNPQPATPSRGGLGPPWLIGFVTDCQPNSAGIPQCNDKNNPYAPNNTEVGSYSLTSSEGESLFDGLVNNYNQNPVPYTALARSSTSYNSNSFAYTVLVDIGAYPAYIGDPSNYNPSKGFRNPLIGWGHLVPGLVFP